MNTLKHAALGAAVGAAAALLPDAALYCFGWRREWLPEAHPLVRLHRALHAPASIVAAAAVAGWASHVVADRYSEHRAAPAQARLDFETVEVPEWGGSVRVRPLTQDELTRLIRPALDHFLGGLETRES